MKRWISLLTVIAMSVCLLTGCGSSGTETDTSATAAEASATAGTEASVDTTNYIKVAEETNPDIVDPQCTSEYYTVSMNVFDRLVEVKAEDDGTSEIVPSLATDWTVSDDGLTYSFTLQDGVKFSNGADLTASDVLYSFVRLLSYEKSVNSSVIDMIEGAQEVIDGTTTELSGFKITDDTHFTITLTEPYGAFLACLTTPACSIFDEETTKAAGDQFGIDPSVTIGTGPFIFTSWTLNSEMVLSANKNCWSGAPASEGLDIKIVPDADTQRMMFESGELDILDLDNAASQTDYFLSSDTYKDQIVSGNRVGIYYVSLNENCEPLGDVNVRKALQMSVDRQGILDAEFGGRGTLENGIFPHGLIGYNADLPEIEYNVEEAKQLLADAGYADGFDLEIDESTEAGQTTKDINQILQAEWGEIGINVTVKDIDDATYTDMRRGGEVMCFNSNWSADFNDPDNFIYTFFGNADNAKSRSLNYSNTDVMERVAAARAIVDDDERIAEYQDLEKIIVQDDAAWVPLFSKQHLFVVNPRITGFTVSWNGWSCNYYRNVGVTA